jgi:thiol-disulfide isomerase/thioredoxin
VKKLLLLFVGTIATFGAAAADADGGGPAFGNAIGWTWHFKPSAARWSVHSLGVLDIVMQQYEINGDNLLLTLAYLPQAHKDIVEFRPVAFDASGQRFEFAFDSSGGSSNITLQGYLLDLKKLPRAQMKFIGVEKLPRDNVRDVLAPAAFQQLKDAGIKALPFPRIGVRYDFELTAADGMKINSRNLRGKVVLLNFWASWCGPCMAKMPKLKGMYHRLHSRGFEIVGLNHDHTLADAERAIAKQALPWPNIPGPADDGHRELWGKTTGTLALPRLLLIDRDGILRAEVSADELEADIAKLISKR